MLTPRPRSLLYFPGSRITEKLQERVHDQEQEAAAQAPDADQPTDDLWSAVDSAIRRVSGNSVDEDLSRPIPSQLSAYLASPPVDRRSNPNVLAVWERLRPGLEELHAVAMEYMVIMASSTAAERLFSHAGEIATKKRCRLSPANVDRLVFLRSLPKEWWFEVQ